MIASGDLMSKRCMNKVNDKITSSLSTFEQLKANLLAKLQNVPAAIETFKTAITNTLDCLDNEKSDCYDNGKKIESKMK